MKKFFFVFLLLATNVFGISLEKAENRIRKIIDELPSSTVAAVLVYNPLTRDTIFQINAKKPMVPASNTKLFTTATALELMGPDYPLKTVLYTDDKNLKDGVINGNLYLKGYGNSLFTSRDIDSMVIVLRKMGIKKVTGNIIGDDSYFDEIYKRADWIEQEHSHVRIPPVSALVVNRNTVITYKRYRHRHYRRFIHYFKSPPLEAAEILRSSLRRHGIKVYGKAEKGITPENVTTLAESKVMLKDLIKRINKHSDNFLAECLFKTLGAFSSKKQGNSLYSTQAILDFINDNGIYSLGTSVVDGSGISKYNTMTPCAIIGLLEKMYFDLRDFQYFYNSLSIAGVDGTLEDRMIHTTAENNFRGKTGTLNGVSNVSGYIKTMQKNELIVSMLFHFDRGSERYYHEVQDRIIATLSAIE